MGHGINCAFADQLKMFYCSNEECLTVVIQLDTVAVQIRYLKQTAVRTDYGEMCRPRSAQLQTKSKTGLDLGNSD